MTPSEFQELILRIAPAEREVLGQGLSRVTPDKVDAVARAVIEGNYQARIFSEPDFHYAALAAVRESRISATTFGTLMLYRSACERHDQVDVVPLFLSDGRINEKARAAIQESIVLSRGCVPVQLLSDGEVEGLILSMRDLPRSEQRIFIVDRDPELSETVSDVIFNELKLNWFNRTSGDKKRMLPTLGLVERFLKCKFGESAVMPYLVLGLSSVQEIDESLRQGRRPVALPFPGVQLPDIADRYLAPDYEFTYHDLYHLFSASCAPLVNREIILKIADMIRQHISPTAEGINLWYEKLVDMDVISYLNQDADHITWRIIFEWFQSASGKFPIEPEVSRKIFQAIGSIVGGKVRLTPQEIMRGMNEYVAGQVEELTKAAMSLTGMPRLKILSKIEALRASLASHPIHWIL